MLWEKAVYVNVTAETEHFLSAFHNESDEWLEAKALIR